LAPFTPGQIVVADWRDAVPREPNKLRPAIVVEDSSLFGPTYPNVILVPLTQDHNLAVADLSVSIEPTPENGCTKRCYALSLAVVSTSKRRVRPTRSHVTPEQLKTIREQIATAIGLGRRSTSF